MTEDEIEQLRWRIGAWEALERAAERWDDVGRVMTGATSTKEAARELAAVLDIADHHVSVVMDMQVRRLLPEYRKRLRRDLRDDRARLAELSPPSAAD